MHFPSAGSCCYDLAHLCWFSHPSGPESPWQRPPTGLADCFNEQNVQAMKAISGRFHFLSLRGQALVPKDRPLSSPAAAAVTGDRELQLKALPCFKVLWHFLRCCAWRQLSSSVFLCRGPGWWRSLTANLKVLQVTRKGWDQLSQGHLCQMLV